MSKAKKIEVKGSEVRVLAEEAKDYISLTDIACYKESARTDHVIQNWMRNRNTIKFLRVWEQLKNKVGLNSFVLTHEPCVKRLEDK